MTRSVHSSTKAGKRREISFSSPNHWRARRWKSALSSRTRNRSHLRKLPERLDVGLPSHRCCPVCFNLRNLLTARAVVRYALDQVDKYHDSLFRRPRGSEFLVFFLFSSVIWHTPLGDLLGIAYLLDRTATPTDRRRRRSCLVKSLMKGSLLHNDVMLPDLVCSRVWQ